MGGRAHSPNAIGSVVPPFGSSTGALVLAGDVIGPIGANTIDAIQGNPVVAPGPLAGGDVLQWSGAAWVNVPAGGLGVTLDDVITTLVPDNDVIVPAADPVVFRDGAIAGADLFTLIRTAVGADRGLYVDMGAVTAGVGIEALIAGSGIGFYLNNTGTGSAVLIQDAASDVLDITAAGRVVFTPTLGEDFALDTTGAGAISLDSAAPSNFTVSGAANDLTFGARAATITLNEVGQTVLDANFTATSIIGALNEIAPITGPFLYKPGIAGGQSAFGGTAAADDLTFAANTVGTGAGRIRANSPFVLGAYSATTAAYAFDYSAVESFTAGFIGGGLNFSGTITFSNALFIYESFRGAPTITTAVAPGFAAYTVLQALPRFVGGALAAHNPLAPLIVNAGPQLAVVNAVAHTVANCAGINWAASLRGEIAGGSITTTAFTGLTSQPSFSTVAGSTVNFGTVRGLWARTPSVALFGSAAGVETMTAYYAVDVDNLGTFGGTAPVAALRSAITAGTNQNFLLNTGGATSSFGAGLATWSDNAGVVLGTGLDVLLNWNGTALEFDPLVGDDLRIAFAAGSHTITSSSGSATRQIRFGMPKGSFGQTGLVGNQKYVFVANAETVTVGGGYSQFLLTQAANDTLNAAIGTYAGWTINAPSPVIGTGSLTTGAALVVGGNPSTAATNRVGVQILSNPAGGAGINAALWVTAGSSRFDGRVDINNGIALGAGAAATLGLIGGAGPTAAAQAQWLEIDIGGVAHWIPVWT